MFGKYYILRKDGNVQYYTGGAENQLDNVVYFNPTSNTGKCDNYVASNSATGAKTGCMKWFIYSIDDKGTIDKSDDVANMLLDHNTTDGIAWNSMNNYTGPSADFLAQLENDTSGWTSNKIISPSPSSTSSTGSEASSIPS